MQKNKHFSNCIKILEQDHFFGAVYLGFFFQTILIFFYSIKKGDITAAINVRLLLHLNIKAILTTASGCKLKFKP